MLSRFKLSVVAGAEIQGNVQSTMLFPIGRVPVEIGEAGGPFESRPVSGNIHALVDLPPATRVSEQPLRKAA
jgi:hypothetical protein